MEEDYLFISWPNYNNSNNIPQETGTFNFCTQNRIAVTDVVDLSARIYNIMKLRGEIML